MKEGEDTEIYIRGFITVVRYILPLLSAILVLVCTKNLIFTRKTKERIILFTDDMKEYEVNKGEVIVGSAEDCDIVIDSLADRHFAFSVSFGKWKIRNIFGKKLSVNGKKIKGETNILPDDIIEAQGKRMSFRLKNKRGYKEGDLVLDKAIAFASLNLIQIFVLLSLTFSLKENFLSITIVYLSLIFGQWIYMLVTKFAGAFLEIPILFLITFMFSVVAHKSGYDILKQAICLVIGFIGAIVLYFTIKSTKIAWRLKIIAIMCGVAILVFNILFGITYNGSQNWVEIGNFTFQPSELVKVILIFVCACATEKLSDKKDMVLFSAFSIFCLICLAYMRDFGTALVYICVFVTVLLIRSCSLKLLSIMAGASLLLGVIVTFAFPYVSKRIFSFGQAFENASSSGYQQTRAMIAAASGGLFGVGGGKGTIVKVSASDTDIVFGMITEEFGLIIAVLILLVFCMFTLYAIKTLSVSSSSYYSVTCCATAILFLAQTSLNVFGSMDMLPFTGVTLPFISNGGSSLISSVMLIAFFRAAVIDETKKSSLKRGRGYE